MHRADPKERRFNAMRRIIPIALLIHLVAGPVLADAPPANSSSVAAPELPLPELPTMPSAVLPPPKPAAIQALDTRIEQLLSQDVSHPAEPKVDFAFLIGDLDEDAIPAIAQRMEQLRRSIDGRGALGFLERARKAGSKALERSSGPPGQGGQKGKPATPHKAADTAAREENGDWLQFALALQKSSDPAWRDLVQVYGMLRMLEALRSTASVRVMLTAYGYFGELVRIDLRRAIGRLGDRAVPALIEAREHDARKVRDWARRELEAIGRAIPGEAVSTADPDVLADVLLAFGRVRDVDAARVILSFVASERVQLKNAARQAITAIGEPGTWHLRDAYESATGEKPSRSWDHKRLTQELFRLHDRSRMTAVHELMEKGIELAKKGDPTQAVASFDQVLARLPLFERRSEMASTYAAYATELERTEKLDESLVALRTALRLHPETAELQRLESRVATLEGRILAKRGTPDPFILRRAIDLDPTNSAARDLLKKLETRTLTIENKTKRYAAAGAITLAALLAMIWLWRRRSAVPGPPTTTVVPNRQNDETGDLNP